MHIESVYYIMIICKILLIRTEYRSKVSTIHIVSDQWNGTEPYIEGVYYIYSHLLSVCKGKEKMFYMLSEVGEYKPIIHNHFVLNSLTCKHADTAPKLILFG